MAQWYCITNNQEVGPTSTEQILSMLQAGRLAWRTPVRLDGTKQWMEAWQAPDFAAHAPSQSEVMESGDETSLAPGHFVSGERCSYAGFWKRFAAALIDLMALAAVSNALAAVLDIPLGVSGERGIFDAASIVVYWLYFAMQESGPKRATLGKRALRIAVCDLNGNRLSFGRATARHFGKILFGMGFIFAAFTERKQALHDMVAGTLVVDSHVD